MTLTALKHVCNKFFGADGGKAAYMHAREFGLRSALTPLSPAERKDFRRLLHVFAPETYKPDIIWSAQKEMLCRYFPQFGADKYSV